MKSLMGKIHNLSRLRLALLAFVFCLGAPACVLVYYSLSEIKWEAYHQQRTLAIELTDRINFQLNHWVQVEERRGYSDYQFLVVSGDPAANYFQPSPLSNISPIDSLPGTVGFFQVDSNGKFSSPSLPNSFQEASVFGITLEEYQKRDQIRKQVLQVLLDNQLLDNNLLSGRNQSIAAPLNKELADNKSDNIQESREQSGVIELPNRQQQLTGNSPMTLLDNQRERARNQSKDKLVISEAVEQTSAFDNLSLQNAQKKNLVEEKQLLRDLDLDSKLQEAAAKKKAVSSVASSSNYSRPAPRKEQTILPRAPSVSSSDIQSFDPRFGSELESVAEEDPAELSAPVSSDIVLADRASIDQSNQVASLQNVTVFESEIDPFEFSPLKSGHMVFFRKVWRQGERTIQGLVLDPEQFLQGTIGREYRDTVLSSVVDLVVAYKADVLSIFQGDQRFSSNSRVSSLSGELLHQARLAPPFNDIELWFSINQVPSGPGAQVVRWSAIVMAFVLGLGTYLIYRLGLRQMRLAQQQQDFVSAVSHELKTPLTSIRMYGEMLREGWADEPKKRQYYDYIYEESERLSRLIANVLQLAKMNRREFEVNVRAVTLSELIDNLQSKLIRQVESSGFELSINIDSNLKTTQVLTDSDAFLQVLINLVDNALKFSAKSETKKIEISVSEFDKQEIKFSVRDFGPGIDKQHLSKIFDLFYRAENELTRETVGTGIGLALVNQLLMAMNGRIEVCNREPGAEFSLFLNIVS